MHSWHAFMLHFCYLWILYSKRSYAYLYHPIYIYSLNMLGCSIYLQMYIYIYTHICVYKYTHAPRKYNTQHCPTSSLYLCAVQNIDCLVTTYIFLTPYIYYLHTFHSVPIYDSLHSVPIYEMRTYLGHLTPPAMPFSTGIIDDKPMDLLQFLPNFSNKPKYHIKIH